MKWVNIARVIKLLLLGAILSGCLGHAITTVSTPPPTTAVANSIYASNTPVSPPTSTAKPVIKPPALPTVTPISIFARISPAVAFIETPIRAGSGLLIEDGYVVTNAHVVWPFQEVRVVFPDGSECLHAPIVNWDLLTDLAIIGPFQTPVRPARLTNGEDLDIGSDVFLIGYPGEAEQYPQPTLTRGVISRFREWEPLKITYFQTDALMADGQSGGVLVSEQGKIIGISGFFFTAEKFGLVASAADVLPYIQSLIANQNIAHNEQRRIPLAAGKGAGEFTLQHEWDSKIYIINEPVETTVDLTLESKNDAVFAVFDVFGRFLVFANDGLGGIEAGSTTTPLSAPAFVILGQYSDKPGTFHVRSNRDLIPYDDKDDGTNITAGQTLRANTDCPGDVDYFITNLAAGDTIDIIVSSVQIDPFLIIDYPQAQAQEVIRTNDSGEGLFGQDARLTYTAPHSGVYFIIVGDTLRKHVGGYLLTVKPVNEPLF